MDIDRSADLTAKQREFFDLLLELRRQEGLPPTVRELQRAGGFKSPRSVLQYLEALEAAGYLARGEGARNIRILRAPPTPQADRTETVQIPIIGHVAAGLPILAEENVQGYVAVSTRLARPPHQYFLLRVDGDSMDRAGIQDGDLVLVRQQSVANAGDSVIALIDDSATVKRLRPGPGTIALEPHSSNPAHQPIIVDAEFQIQGVVVGTVRTGPESDGEDQQ